MPGGEQDNLRPRYAGLPPPSFRAGDILGPRCISFLNEGSPALSVLLAPSPPSELSLTLKPSYRTDDLLETNCDLCSHEAVNPLQVYFCSYILPYFCTGKPKFSY